MEFFIEPGKYVLAVSGGVDSVVLLDLLSKQTNLELVVAHYDHGIRLDSYEDLEFVKELASKKDLEFYSESGSLGTEASEELARRKRYQFLRKIKKETNAKAIVTAHHQDDLIETVIMNVIRGTNRHGLAPMLRNKQIIRPLLKVTKNDIKEYARENDIKWREDLTNASDNYLRNKIRHHIMPSLSNDNRAKILDIIFRLNEVNGELDDILERLPKPILSDRLLITRLPYSISREIMASWLASSGFELNRKLLDRVVVGVKTLPVGSLINISKNKFLMINETNLIIKER